MIKHTIKRHTIWILTILMLICLGVLVGIQIRYMGMMKNQTTNLQDMKGKEYKYHCAFISEGYEDPFWNSIYEGAKKQGETEDVYVENYGQKLSLHYSINEKLSMAIAASVDAIIMEGDGEVDTTHLIDKAIDQGIVVITVYQDQLQSKRRSFIGVNKFEMGYNLCKKAYEYLKDDNDEIIVLYDKKNELNPENTILNSGMKKYLNEQSSQAKLNPQIIDSSETYNTEEQIRELLRNRSSRPKVLVCTNLIQTQCAYQTIVDLNCVGDVNILGFYSNQSVIEAINKGVIEATMMVDTTQMGEEAVNSLVEFIKYGYVSDYIAVKTNIIGKSEAKQLINQTSDKNTSSKKK